MRFPQAVFGFAFAFVLGCSFAAPPDAEPIANLRTELVVVQQEIKGAEAENAKLAGGLVKSSIEVRLELLKTSQELSSIHTSG
ncbi:MAG: hypothetical protein P8Y94_11025 [Acidobacteriota bacterium]